MPTSRHLTRICLGCHQVFGAGRRDCWHCSPECRSAFYRRRKRAARRNKPCLVCGVTFCGLETKKYCSSKCRNNKLILQLRQCLTCEAEFTPSRKGKAGKYCRRACMPPDVVAKQREAGRRNEARPQRKQRGDRLRSQVWLCVFCNEAFHPQRSIERRKPWCSRKCFVEHNPIHGPHISEADRMKICEANRIRKCEWCGKPFDQRGTNRRFCGDACMRCVEGLKTDIQYLNCRECGKLIVQRDNVKRLSCSQSCRKRHEKRIRRHKLRAASESHDAISKQALGDRDGWRCHICGKPIPNREHKNRPLDPEIDHLIPVSAGGAHVWENVALAHRRCNGERSNMGPAQLRLIG